MTEEKKGTWGGNRKSKWSFKLPTKTLNIPSPYHETCKEYAKQLEDKDVENGRVYQNEDGKWIYRD